MSDYDLHIHHRNICVTHEPVCYVVQASVVCGDHMDDTLLLLPVGCLFAVVISNPNSD